MGPELGKLRKEDASESRVGFRVRFCLRRWGRVESRGGVMNFLIPLLKKQRQEDCVNRSKENK